MLKRLLNFLLRRTPEANPEREMFLTHTPTFFTPGKVHEGMLITRQERIGDTALIDGGRAPCWRIWGRDGCHGAPNAQSKPPAESGSA